jgi:hypothetical protein
MNINWLCDCIIDDICREVCDEVVRSTSGVGFLWTAQTGGGLHWNDCCFGNCMWNVLWFVSIGGDRSAQTGLGVETDWGREGWGASATGGHGGGQGAYTDVP